MFHEGSLQSGIALAIQQQKLVACFVRDEGEESSTWENDWLQIDHLSTLLAKSSVILRLTAGSTEAGFLAAFCPLSQIPTLVIIHNGQLREQLVSGISQADFICRLRAVLEGDESAKAEQTSTDSTANPVPYETPNPQARSTPPITSVASNTFTPTPSQSEHPPTLVDQSDIRASTETTTENAARTSKAKGKQKAVEADPKAVTKADQASAAALVRKKKQDEKDELKRIQARIEADKRERRAQAEARKAERKRLEQEGSADEQIHQIRSSRAGGNSKEVHLNVRLFDGRNVRRSFPRTATLDHDVRPWIDEEFRANAELPSERLPPFTFKQILAPLPSRTLSASDEAATLGEIDLAPSATLVLTPIQGYTEAYSSTGGGLLGGLYGGVTGVVGGALGLVGSGVGMVGSALGSIAGYGAQPAASAESASTEGRTMGSALTGSSNEAGIRVRTLADQRMMERETNPRDQQFYNGNQTNFEPNDGNDRK